MRMDVLPQFCWRLIYNKNLVNKTRKFPEQEPLAEFQVDWTPQALESKTSAHSGYARRIFLDSSLDYT
jgi:hypothetical protein